MLAMLVLVLGPAIGLLSKAEVRDILDRRWNGLRAG